MQWLWGDGYGRIVKSDGLVEQDCGRLSVVLNPDLRLSWLNNTSRLQFDCKVECWKGCQHQGQPEDNDDDDDDDDLDEEDV